ncbi:LacI family DNA-binding transcriptional regulator [Motilibacter peucedani]|uniref:LacI family DNA-binding transcriptional regulator n=1 Tax=Motilibacter peucedani TaxID=598650 RepID=UPI000EB56A81|nr:LacI family DNA-binding transcriptional regulator [Motilibacter peucedani]
MPTSEGAHPKSRTAARRAQRRAPTIDDVALAAGVSRGTVSRVLNGGHYVSPASLTAVTRAMRETGYVVNQSARTLVTGRASAVAFVLPEPQERLFEDPNFSVLLRTCTRALAERDYSLVLMLAESAEAHERVMRYVRSGHVDGVLLISTHAGDPFLEQLDRGGVAAVACGKPLGHEGGLPYVAADDREGARQMTRYLLEQGRTRVATITGPLDTPGGRERLEGYRDVLGRRALKRRIASATDFSIEAGDAAMTDLLARSPDLDAVFVASDLLAAGALQALRRAGRSVPDEVAVGGFDDSRLAESTQPALTTVRQPLERVATEMVDVLLQLIAGEPVASRILPTELVRRGSA